KDIARSDAPRCPTSFLPPGRRSIAPGGSDKRPGRGQWPERRGGTRRHRGGPGELDETAACGHLLFLPDRPAFSVLNSRRLCVIPPRPPFLKSLQLDIGGADNLAPLLDLGADVGAELL